MQVSIKKLEANRRNAKKAGRPKGKKEPQTLEKERVNAAVQQRIFKMAQGYIGAQSLIAHGTHTLMRIDEVTEYRDSGRFDKKGNPTKNKYTTKKFTVVTNPSEIEKVLNEFEDVDGAGVVDDKYYFITHEKPNNQALDSLLNRGLGKPTETIDLGNKDEKPFLVFDR